MAKKEKIPQYLYGLYRSGQGSKPVVMARASDEHYDAIMIEGNLLYIQFILASELPQYFKEWGNEITNKKRLQNVARFMLRKSELSGLKREMSQSVKDILDKIIGLPK